MEHQMAAESLRVSDVNGKLCDDLPLVLSVDAVENEILNVDLLEDLDSYWEDINDRLTISRMVSDSVIKGMVNAVTQEAGESIAQKEHELARLKQTLKLYHMGVNGNGILGSPMAQNKLNSTDIALSCSCADASLEQDKLAESLRSLRNVAREQFKKLTKEITKIRDCGPIKKMNSNSVGLGGILLEKVPKYSLDVDGTLDSLQATLDTVYKQVDDMVCVSKTSLREWQLERDFQEEIEDIVIKSCLQSVQDELEERLRDENTSLYSSGSAKWNEVTKEIASLRQQLDAISKSLSVPEIGLLISHGSLDIGEEWNNNKWTDNFHRSMSGNHISSSSSLWEGNGKLEESIVAPESLDGAQLKHMTKDDLINYFKAEMTKMKRNFESREEMITDRYFSLRREYLKVKGSSLPSKKEKEFDILRKKIPEVILKLDGILGQSVKLPTISKDGESLINWKGKFDSLVSENHQLRYLLTDKEREVECLSAQLFYAKEKNSDNYLAEENFVKMIGDPMCGIEDAHIHTSICEDVYECIFREVIDRIRCFTEESEMKSHIMQEIYEVIFTQAVQNAELVNNTEDSSMESIFMQDLLEVVLIEAIKEANEKLNVSDIRYTEENKIRVLFEMQALETEKDLMLEIEENKRLNQELFRLDTSLKEKEKFMLETEAGLAKVNEQFETASQELNSLREQACRQQIVISESSEALDIMKGDLNKAWEQIELQKMEIFQLQEKLEQTDQERNMLNAAVREKQNALLIVEVKEREQKKQLESITLRVQQLSQLAADFAHRVTEEIKTNSLRLESMSYQMSDLIKRASLVRSTGFMYKQKLERRCSDLQKAEAEVDLLGDEVDVLLGLLEKIYIALDHYSPILKHYPGIVEILKLVRRELNGETTKSV